MIHPDDDKLYGTVAVDLYSLAEKTDGDKWVDEKLVWIAVELNEDKTLGRIRMGDKDEIDFNVFIKMVVKSDSTITYDKNIGNNKLSEKDYVLKPVQKDPKSNLLQPINTVVVYLKEKRLFNSLQCSYFDKHFSYYLDECCFKFNNQTPENRFYKLLNNAVKIPPILPDAIKEMGTYNLWQIKTLQQSEISAEQQRKERKEKKTSQDF